MIKIVDKRCTGKTTKLLQCAHENGYILVVPNFRALACTVELARKLGYGDVEIITASMFMKNGYSDRDKKYLIDELDWFLDTIDVAGYSNSTEENEEP